MSITLLSGDARDVLPTLATNSVHTCVTSPPYYALRDYGCAGQIGLEATPDEYLATMVAVFREVRRVLRPDGTCWVNVGDSYSGNGTTGRNDAGRNFTGGGGNTLGSGNPGFQGNVSRGAKPKDLLLMPARLALALQADGWWLRSDIIWAKPNPMPESVTDRPTSAHEHVFLLSKSRRYYFDSDAIREEPTGRTDPISSFGHVPGSNHNANGYQLDAMKGRNCRNVWTLATESFSGSHFATFPTALAERCIRAGTSERGCCSACGAPWRRTTDTIRTQDPRRHTGRAAVGCDDRTDGDWPRMIAETVTTGWSASCACAADVVPATVLDPFAGASTTLLVAQRLQRQAIGIELNPEYVKMGRQRIEDEAGLFADVQTLGGVRVADAPLLFSSWPPAGDPADARMAYEARQRDLFAEAAD